MKTLYDSYATRHPCTPAEFRYRLFWATLHRRALPLAPLLLLSNHFAADRDLLAACANAPSMQDIRENILDHRFHPRNEGVLRILGVRVSVRRLMRFARKYLQQDERSYAGALAEELRDQSDLSSAQ